MKNIFVVFLLTLAGFFPYMPVFHGTPQIHHGSHHHGCSGEKQDTGHPMTDCIQAVHDIALWNKSQSLTTNTLAIPVPQFSFGKYQTLKFAYITKIQSPKQDPPFFTSHHLVGIVILTT